MRGLPQATSCQAMMLLLDNNRLRFAVHNGAVVFRSNAKLVNASFIPGGCFQLSRFPYRILTQTGCTMYFSMWSPLIIKGDLGYRASLSGLDAHFSRYRYIYNKSAWLTAGKAEPAPKNRLYLHPDSPYTGEQVSCLQKSSHLCHLFFRLK